MLPVRVGWGGWVRFVDVDGDATLVRATRAPESDRLYVAELYLERAHGFTADELRRIDLDAIGRELNSPRLHSQVLESLDFPGIDLATAADHFGTTFTAGQQNWVADMVLSQVPGSGVTRVPRRRLSFDEPEVMRVDLMEVARIPGVDVFTEEDPRRRPDSFYLKVFELGGPDGELKWLAPGRSPAKLISEANDVPLTTVNKWLRRGKDIVMREGSK